MNNIKDVIKTEFGIVIKPALKTNHLHMIEDGGYPKLANHLASRTFNNPLIKCMSRVKNFLEVKEKLNLPEDVKLSQVLEKTLHQHPNLAYHDLPHELIEMVYCDFFTNDFAEKKSALIGNPNVEFDLDNKSIEVSTFYPKELEYLANKHGNLMIYGNTVFIIEADKRRVVDTAYDIMVELN